jgi:hypothetical protein
VLRPGGVLLFSSHNLACTRAKRAPTLEFRAHPRELARGVLEWLRQVRNHARIGPLREVHEDFAILNDIGHDFECLHYYVDSSHQCRQLEALGWEVLDVFDRDGKTGGPRDPHPESSSLLYVARRDLSVA